MCNINNKIYIGYTTRSMEERWKEHVTSSNIGSKFHFHNAIRKYGENSFSHEVLFNGEFENLKEIHIMEQKYIEEYNSYNEGYNSTKGGEGCIGLIVSEEIREKLRVVALKENLSEEKLIKMRNAKLGTKLSDDVKFKLSEAHKGKKNSKEHNENISKSKKEFYSNIENRLKECDKNSKFYNIQNEYLNINLNIKNLKKYCIENEINYKQLHKTIKTNKPTHEGWIAYKI